MFICHDTPHFMMWEKKCFSMMNFDISEISVIHEYLIIKESHADYPPT